MTRDHYVAGVMPDFVRRYRHQAVRRTVPTRQVEQLKARWFGLGALAAALPLVLGIVLIRTFGG